MEYKNLLEVFDSPSVSQFFIEHISDEFTSVCPKTGHPDFGSVTLHYEPLKKCVELKSLKIYYQSFRDRGIYYEEVTNKIRDDLVETIDPRWLRVVTNWKGRGGIKSRIVASYGDVLLNF